MVYWLKEYILYIAWMISLASMLGSLYFSDVEYFAPCTLCWYQRIAMYPLVVILLVGILQKDKNVWRFGLPLAIIGWLIAVYHNLLYYKVLPEAAATCRAGISCTTEYISWFGFITIPFLSFIAFSLIIGSLLYYRRITNEQRA